MNNPRTRPVRRLSAVMLSTLIGFALLAGVFVTIVKADAGILLTRTPAPPSAILNPGGTERYRATFVFNSQPDFMLVLVQGPDGIVYKCNFYDETFNSGVDTPPAGSGCADAVSYTYQDVGQIDQPPPATDDLFVTPLLPWIVPSGAPNGQYTVYAEYWSIVSREAGAFVNFYVYETVGDLWLFKFEDTNGNGVQDSGELGINWTIGVSITYPFDEYFEFSTGTTGTRYLNNVPTVLYTFTEATLPAWSRVTPSVFPYTLTVTNTAPVTATFGNIQNSDMSCQLLHTTPKSNYVAGDYITYTLSYTKTGADEGVVPVATLGFERAILAWDGDTSGTSHTGTGTVADPYKWTFSNAGTLTQTNYFDVWLHFTDNPSNETITATGSYSSTYLANPATNRCQSTQPFGPTAVTLGALEARSSNPATGLLLGASAVAILSLATLALVRRRKYANNL